MVMKNGRYLASLIKTPSILGITSEGHRQEARVDAACC